MSKPATLLLIDDDERGTAIRAHLLRTLGYTVVCAFSGRAGIRQAVRHPVDLIILDFHLPDLNGDAVLAELRHLEPQIPVILLAGILGVQEGFHERGATQPDITIIKGEGPKVLLAAIRSLLPSHL